VIGSNSIFRAVVLWFLWFRLWEAMVTQHQNFDQWKLYDLKKKMVSQHQISEVVSGWATEENRLA
jgi:hypothetical protein